MEPVEAVLLLVAVGLAAGVVLRDIAAYERPPRPPRVRAPREPKPARTAREPRERPADSPRGGGNVRVATPGQVAFEPAAHAEPRLAYEGTSMLGTLAATEHDERSAGRRVFSALLLLTVTLLFASLIGAGIYRGLQNLGQ